MSKKTATSSQRNDKLDRDELEEEFLNNCKIEDIPLPKSELENYQNELREVMKSGCNLQIAEYSLLQYNICEKLEEKKKEYNKLKDEYMKKINDEIETYINDLKENKSMNQDNDDKENDDKKNNDKENDEKNDDNNNYYEEEADEIFERNQKEIEDLKNCYKDKSQIKEEIMNIFKNGVEGTENEKDFRNAKDEYTKKRDAIIEAALRLVKKIVNDENEYKAFYKGYYGNGKEYQE